MATGFRRFGLRAAAVVLVINAAPGGALAQHTSSDARQPADEPRVYRTIDSRIAIGRSVHVAADEPPALRQYLSAYAGTLPDAEVGAGPAGTVRLRSCIG